VAARSGQLRGLVCPCWAVQCSAVRCRAPAFLPSSGRAQPCLPPLSQLACEPCRWAKAADGPAASLDCIACAAAGLYDSIPGIPSADAEAVQRAVCRVWASLFSRRAVLSRQAAGEERGLPRGTAGCLNVPKLLSMGGLPHKHAGCTCCSHPLGRPATH
jgi:hypothetical protein